MMATSNGRMQGRTAIVTGASRGLGKAIALAFAQEGASVAVVARSEAQWDPRLPGTIHETVAEIQAIGGRAVAVPADLSRAEDIERVVAVTRAELGPITLLINNAALTVPGRPPVLGAASAMSAAGAGSLAGLAAGAGSGSGSDATRTSASGPTGDAAAGATAGSTMPRLAANSFLSFPLKGFRMHFEIGLFASYRLMQLVLPDMVAAGLGGVVNISSVAGFIPGEGPYERAGNPGPLAYGGNKAALHHLTQIVACEMQPHGIAVNVLSPSEPVITPGNLVAAAGEKNWASPEEFAEATVRVALADPAVMNGQLLWSDDIVFPERGTRGWLRPLT